MMGSMLVAVLLLSPPTPEEPPPWPQGRMEHHVRFVRPDKASGHATIYLPAAYEKSRRARFPVLVLLHGLGGSDSDWTRHGHIQELLDEAIGTGKMQPVIAVMPDGGNGYWTNWVGNAPNRRYESLVEPDCTHWVDRRYRTDGRRAIAGISMGGFGAMSIALRHRDRYQAVASLSGALFLAPPTGRRVYLAAFGFPGPHQWRFSTVNPYDLIRLGYAEGLPIWLDCGSDDRDKFTRGLRGTSKALKRAGVSHVARFRPGKHRWEVWRRALQDVLPWIDRKLRATKPRQGAN